MCFSIDDTVPPCLDIVQIDNQPLATGFYISTAPTGAMPDWFWSTCPAAKRRSPVHLKSSLHLHTPHVQQNDELAFGGSSKASLSQQHPLDSTRTDDALKSVFALCYLLVDQVKTSRFLFGAFFLAYKEDASSSWIVVMTSQSDPH